MMDNILVAFVFWLSIGLTYYNFWKRGCLARREAALKRAEEKLELDRMMGAFAGKILVDVYTVPAKQDGESVIISQPVQADLGYSIEARRN